MGPGRPGQLGHRHDAPPGGTPAPQARTHNRQNQLTAIGGVPLDYDNNGNTTQGEPGKGYAYDAWNRLVRVTTATASVSYAFDALGRRVWESKTVGPTTTTRELYYSDGWQVLEERDGFSGAVLAQNVWSPVYVDALVLRDQGGQRYYVQQDANQNVTALTDAAGTVLERYVYDPYGAVTVLTAQWGTPSSLSTWVYLHQGGRYDGDTGLYDFRNRYYEPKLGRWLNLDPIEYEAGDSNLYGYLGNGPVSAVDPAGLDKTIWGLYVGNLHHLGEAHWRSFGSWSRDEKHVILVSKYCTDDAEFWADRMTRDADNNVKKGLLNTFQSASFLRRYEDNSIDVLVAGGHNTPGEVGVSALNLKDLRASPEVARSITRKLKPNATVVLGGCWLAKGQDEMQEIANILKRRVVACIGSTYELALRTDGKWVPFEPTNKPLYPIYDHVHVRGMTLEILAGRARADGSLEIWNLRVALRY